MASASVLQATSTVTNPLKYPHTRAVLASIAASFKQLDSESTDNDQEGDEGQRINGALVSKVVFLLQEEREEELKELLKQSFSIPDSVDESQLDQNVLDLMHKHRDDISGVPFLFLTPTKRPISRPSSRASSHSFRLAPNRPDTPNSLPASPLSSTFRRPHTPATSPLVPPAASPFISTTAGQTQPQPQSQPPQTSSTSSSPLSSPRLLNAKAVEFRPIPRPLSAGGSVTSLVGVALRTDTPSPDLWAHNPSRATSNLAIAAPLIPDVAYAAVPRATTPNTIQRASNIDEDYEDEFDPFSTKPPVATFFPAATNTDVENQWSTTSNSTSSQSTSLESSSSTRTGDEGGTNPYRYPYQFFEGEYEYDQTHNFTQSTEDQTMDDHTMILTDDMTPFEVLSSVFGQSVAPTELTEALEMNGYDFESAVAWLVDKALPHPSQSLPPISAPKPQPHTQMGGRVVVVPREAAFGMRGRGYTSSGGKNSPRYGARPVQGANRVCRYFLGGECMRADCRFSHDIERALCRFWLRGNCAKQDNCEFLHHLPNDVDVSSLTAAMARTDLQGMDSREVSPASTPPPDDFPTLAQQDAPGFGRGRRGPYQRRPFHDPSNTRFATAVKTQVKSVQQLSLRVGARHPDVHRTFGDGPTGNHSSTSSPTPHPSTRIRLRPPTLLPTLPTGDAVNNLYMSYRQRALRLGAARNACLSRAADAWRRGDGAAAKRFSREGHDLNTKMSAESADAAGRLIRERARIAVEAVKQRDTTWSDDPQDRTERGKIVGGGMGVQLGVASKDVGAEGGGTRATPDERTESLLDLHGLHVNEALEVLEKFLVSLEKEGFFGLAYLVVGEEKHSGKHDPSRARLAAGVRDWLHEWGYPWSERDGIVCVDPLTHM